MSLQTEVAELEKNPQLFKVYANPKCNNRCYGRGYLSFVIGKDIITDEDIIDKRICSCVIKALKKDMKNG